MTAMLPLAASLGESINSTFWGFDTAVFRFFGHLQSDFMTIIAKLFTSFGDAAFVVPIIILSLVLCFFKRTRKYGFTIVFAVIIGTLITNLIMKPMVARVRPYNTLQLTDFWNEYQAWYKDAGSLCESDYSFPSGHTTSAFEIAISAFICLMTGKGKTSKKVAWIFPVIAILVGCSRIYLMVHYPTDVLFGALAGTIAAVCGYFLAKLAIKIVEKVKFLDKIDAEKLFKNGIKDNIAHIIITAVVCLALGLSFGILLNEGDEQRCAYQKNNGGTYDCYNEAKVDDEDYPAIDGKEYCKIHWKEINGED